MFIKRIVTLLAALALCAGPSVAAPSGFAIARAPYVFVFPRDHGAHDDYQTEWWYFTGHLRTQAGRKFGYELTFFRFGLRRGDPPLRPGQSGWRGTQTYAAHFAITDERDGRFFYRARFAREALGMGGAATGRLAVHVDDWTLRGFANAAPDRQRMQLHATAGGDALDLTLDPRKPPAIHGLGGVSRKSGCAACASHYYSYTRIATNGVLTYGGARFAVTGVSWMDHEFGSQELDPQVVGWDWFSLQLNDGREVMLYLLRRRDGGVTPESSGSLIARDGRVTHLTLHDFTVVVRGNIHWHSPHTGASYPSLWEVSVPRAGLWASLTPTLADQELALPERALTYWEGAVDVQDVATGGKRLGTGYVELTGYAGAVLR
jgi:predicted secreted hydrolase